jgi:hypothetical protein
MSPHSVDLSVIVARRTGLEPAASGVTGRRYNRLNYRRKRGERLFTTRYAIGNPENARPINSGLPTDLHRQIFAESLNY